MRFNKMGIPIPPHGRFQDYAENILDGEISLHPLGGEGPARREADLHQYPVVEIFLADVGSEARVLAWIYAFRETLRWVECDPRHEAAVITALKPLGFNKIARVSDTCVKFRIWDRVTACARAWVDV